MKQIRNIGIFAHVDAGKTTLSEQILSHAGAIRNKGSVDSGTAHTDTLPVERRRDISVKATRMRGFDRVAHNELALQFYGLGFFDPARAEQALMTIDMMDFPGKDALVQKIGERATMHQKLVQYMQMALTYAQQVDPGAAQMIAQDIMQTLGQEAGGQMAGQMPKVGGQEPPHVQQARQRGQGPEV